MDADAEKPRPEVRISFGSAPAAGARPAAGTPFRIAVLGGFGGRAKCAPGPIAVDRDDLERVMAALDVGLTLTLGEARGTVELAFRELEDFHPDRLFERTPLFDELAKLRRRLANPDTFAEAAAEVSGWGSPSAAPAPEPEPERAQRAPAPDANDADGDGGLLGALVSETERRSAEREAGAGLIDALVREVVAPYVRPAPDPRQDELIAAVDSAIGRGMRALLHHPELQALEATWTALAFLVRRLETGRDLQVLLVDVPKESLRADLASHDDPTRTALGRMLIDGSVGTPGASPWALLVGAYTFDGSAADAQLVGRVARLAARAGAPFVAGGSPALAGCPSFGTTPDPDDWTEAAPAGARAAWDAVRALPEARFVALALPRFLLRLPYGKRSSPTERFRFEELDEGATHEDLLWGNAAFAAATSLGRSFTNDGWDLCPGSEPELERIPLHVPPDADEPTPCAELILTDRGAAKLAASGLMPLYSLVRRDAVRVGRFRAVDGNLLAGPWSG